MGMISSTVFLVLNLRDTKKMQNNKLRLTEKGYAIIVAIESGLLPRVEGGWDDTVFNKFWDKYSADLIKRVPKVKKLLKLS